MDSPTTGPFSPARLGPLHLRNRLIKCATFEGATPEARGECSRVALIGETKAQFLDRGVEYASGQRQ